MLEWLAKHVVSFSQTPASFHGSSTRAPLQKCVRLYHCGELTAFEGLDVIETGSNVVYARHLNEAPLAAGLLKESSEIVFRHLDSIRSAPIVSSRRQLPAKGDSAASLTVAPILQRPAVSGKFFGTAEGTGVSSADTSVHHRSSPAADSGNARISVRRRSRAWLSPHHP